MREGVSGEATHGKSWLAQLVVIESFATAVPVDPGAGVLLGAGNW